MPFRSLLNRNAVAYPVAFLSGTLGWVVGGPTTTVWAFLAGLYGWFVLQSALQFVHAVRKESAHDFRETLLNDDEPALPLTIAGLAFGSAALLWDVGYTPFLPSQTGDWLWWHIFVAFIEMSVWFAMVIGLSLLIVVFLGDIVRRALRNEPIQWRAKL